ncbi:MAG TPA: CerR family C-terminal domain-containing protein [Pseudonocardia sp.]|jgi:AcrR family transcriptional regulator
MRQSVRPAPRRGPGGYGKGDDTRARLIDEALGIFGQRGYAAATTRELASAAGVTLPSLTYYFGGKEGLYIACAEAIVERFRRETEPAAAQALVELGPQLGSEAARNHLKSIFRALVAMFAGPRADRDASFLREVLSTPGPAFDVLYSQWWHPGIELAATLIERASAGRFTGTAARTRAIMMISSLVGFSSGREVLRRAIGPDALGEAVRAEVAAVLDEQIDQISP